MVEQKTKRQQIITIVILVALLVVELISLFNAGDMSSIEARSLYFAKNYFTVSALLPIFNFEMPLYYIIAHFFSFLGNELFFLRLFSMACLLAAFYVLYLLDSLLEISPKHSNTIRYSSVLYNPYCGLFLTLALCFFSVIHNDTVACPDTSALLAVVSSIYFFVAAFIRGNKKYRKAYFVSTLAAVYFAPAAILLFPSQLVCLKRINSDRDSFLTVRRFSVVSIPAIAFLFLSFIKASPLTTSNLFESIAPMNIAISICCLAIATPSKSRHDNDFLVPLIAPTLAFAFLFLYPENNIDDYENHFAKLSAKLSQDKFDIPAIIFKPSGDEKYLIKLKLKEAGRQFYLYPDETDLPPLELGRGFKAAPNPNTLGELKEMLLYTGKVRTVNLSAIDSGDDMPERFDKWAKTVANKKCGYGINADFCLYEMTRAVPKDGILLDLQINHYGDMENAARLMTSKTFYPKMFRAYFLASGSDVVAAVEKLMFACGGDSACEREAARKIENYAVVAGKTDIQAAVAPYIEKRPSEAGGR